MRLLVVKVNFRTPDMTLDGIEPLLADLESISGARVTVVDNDSGDDSLDRLERGIAQRGWSDRVEVVAADRNGGFGYGNNVAIRRALAGDDPPQYVYLLNPDATPQPGATLALMNFLDENPDVGFAGSAIYGPDGAPHGSAFRFPSVLSEFEHGMKLGVLSRLLREFIVARPPPAESCQVDWVTGSSVMIRRQVFEDVGLFDEGFFLYFEETDLCRRARDVGWPTYYVRDSVVEHIGSVSTGMADVQRRRPPFWFASRRRWFLKHGGRSGLWAANVAFAVGFSLWRLRRRIQGKPDRDPPHLLLDFLRYTLAPPARGGAPPP